jgi:hypothetical protein
MILDSQTLRGEIGRVHGYVISNCAIYKTTTFVPLEDMKKQNVGRASPISAGSDVVGFYSFHKGLETSVDILAIKSDGSVVEHVSGAFPQYITLFVEGLFKGVVEKLKNNSTDNKV